MKNRKRLIICLVFLISVGLFILLKIPKTEIGKQEEKAEKILDEKNSEAHLFEDEDQRKSLEEWKEINEDVVALLEADEREFVIVQGRDNEEYLNRSISGKADIYGVPFLDYRNDFRSDDNLIIYGHSTLSEDLLFTFIKKYYDDKYYLYHREMILKSEDKETTYRVLGIGRISSTDPSTLVFEKRAFDNKREMVRFIEEYLNLLDVKYSLSVSLKGRFLTLITCDMDDTEYRYVLLLQEEL